MNYMYQLMFTEFNALRRAASLAHSDYLRRKEDLGRAIDLRNDEAIRANLASLLISRYVLMKLQVLILERINER
ncbi:hypothetical protein [Grimontia marina]|uniref:Uncharacterized protein n=1 Tax=Grimontia marina TaxID=646534 RepID=A0A128EZ97_9GAMM|nr:hypothetical protein [Grimontia marina]CZF79484.1 hypothetical protein GMA8713_00995 [Grimontia marina]